MMPRRLLLTLALAATLAAAFWPRSEKDAEVVGAVAKAQRGPKPAGGSQGQLPARPRAVGEPGRLGAMRADLFPAQTWRPPPPPPPKPVVLPPPPPVAPPLPFVYLGRWKEGGTDVIFLAQGNLLQKMQVGNFLSGWRLDAATDTALTFTWVSLNMQKTLRIAQ
jgi:hypothetical protein